MQKAFWMTVNKLDEEKAKDYVERLGVTDKALALTASLVDIHKWLKDHPASCAVIVSLSCCMAVIIITMIIGIILMVTGVITIGIFTPLVLMIVYMLATFFATSIAVIVIKICGNNSACLPRSCGILSPA